MIRDAAVLRGDKALVQQRRVACQVRRSKQAVMAALDAAVAKVDGRQAVPASLFAADAKTVRKCEGLVPKSLGKAYTYVRGIEEGRRSPDRNAPALEEGARAVDVRSTGYGIVRSTVSCGRQGRPVRH